MIATGSRLVRSSATGGSLPPTTKGINRMKRLLLAPVELLLVAIVGCAPPTVLPASGPPTREPIAFDLNAVIERVAEDCKAPSKVGAWFCDPLIFDALGGEGTTLWVGTSIDPAAPNGEARC